MSYWNILFYLLQLYLLTKQNSSKVNHRMQNLCYSSGKWNMDVMPIHSVHFSSQHSNNYCRNTSKSTFPFVCCYKPFVKFQNQSVCKKTICVCHPKVNFSLAPIVKQITGYINASFIVVAERSWYSIIIFSLKCKWTNYKR